MKEIYVKLSPDERQLYKAVEDRARIEINRYLREGVVMKNYSCILAMLVRLRQVFSRMLHVLIKALYPSVLNPGTYPTKMDKRGR